MSETNFGKEFVIGNYTILSRLGAGGMGTVYKARHRRMNRVVALKILSRDTAGHERSRASDSSERWRRSPSSATPTSSWPTTPVRPKTACTS